MGVALLSARRAWSSGGGTPVLEVGAESAWPHAAQETPELDELRAPSSAAPRGMLGVGSERRQANAGDALGAAGRKCSKRYISLFGAASFAC